MTHDGLIWSLNHKPPSFWYLQL